MKLKQTVISTALIISLCASALALPAGAAETDLKQRQELLEKQIQETENLLNQKKQEENKALQELRQLNNILSTTEKELKNTEKKLQTTEQELNALQAEVAKAEAELSENTKVLSDRLKAMYIEGDVHILEVLLGSSSITDFLTRWDLFSRLAEKDNQLIDQIKQTIAKYKEQQKIIEQKKASLANLKYEQDAKKREIAAASSRQQVVLKQVQSEKSAVEAALDELEAESERIAAELRKLAGDDTSNYGTGTMTWPAPGYSRITSPYGMRVHPILKSKRMHTGIDIGAPMSANVVAADDGKVIESGWRGAYGRVIMINHGNNIVTMYAHLSKSIVNVGDIVKKGQIIGNVGSTGWSTGPHLHFEVRKNGETQDPTKYVKYKK